MFVELFDINLQETVNFDTIGQLKEHLKVIHAHEQDAHKQQEIFDLFLIPSKIFYRDGLIVGNFFEVEVV